MAESQVQIVCDLSIKIQRIMLYADPETKIMLRDLITEFDKIAMADISSSESSEKVVRDKDLSLK